MMFPLTLLAARSLSHCALCRGACLAPEFTAGRLDTTAQLAVVAAVVSTS